MATTLGRKMQDQTTIAPNPKVVTVAEPGGLASLRFSLGHLTVLGCTPPEMTYIAARAGYEYVSFRTIFMGLADEPDYALASKPEMLRQTRTALAGTGLKVHDIELARIAAGVDVKSYLPALETAAELGARHVISSIWTSRRSYALDALAELCDLARTVGCTVNLEFVTWSNVGSLRDAIGVCRAVNQENCGILIDTLHFDRARTRLRSKERRVGKECRSRWSPYH